MMLPYVPIVRLSNFSLRRRHNRKIKEITHAVYAALLHVTFGNSP